MKLKIKVDDTTTVGELRLLGTFFTCLAGERSYLPPTFVAPTDEAAPIFTTPTDKAAPVFVAPTDKAAPVFVAPTDEAELEVPEPTEEPVVHVEVPKRRRRTKAEIAAMDRAGEVVENNPEPEPEPEPAPVTTPSSATPTPGELNTKAAAVAKKIGPEKIRDHIRELGGTLISTLSPDALIAFNDWLDQQ